MRDDGIGMPSGTWRNPLEGGRFGLWSIDRRLDQLGGFLEIEGHGGVCASIVLPRRVVEAHSPER